MAEGLVWRLWVPQSSSPNDTLQIQSVLLGSALGSVLMIILVTLVSCLICRRCVPYRRAHPSLNGGPLYTMHCSSTASGMANMYSFSGQPSSVTTPLDAPHVLVDLDNPEHAYTIPMNTQRGLARHLTAGGLMGCETPTDPPPPYNEANHASPADNIIHGNSPSSNRFYELGTTSCVKYSLQLNATGVFSKTIQSGYDVHTLLR
ncbi:uncharacterized protein CDAR_432861 [Caerostris darwini]|uniref:Uncharacterized protein n=1 Tax=Caerostris darwini TaxID=1538125 RepID=A0AAV4QGM2_9ARAC|nr:uncharacterized protein CDAR_432861 [Caerostris darwini]